MSGQSYAKTAKDDNGSKELMDLRNRKCIRLYFKIVLINVFMSVWYFVNVRKSR